jgi:hypothetical protein
LQETGRMAKSDGGPSLLLCTRNCVIRHSDKPLACALLAGTYQRRPFGSDAAPPELSTPAGWRNRRRIDRVQTIQRDLGSVATLSLEFGRVAPSGCCLRVVSGARGPELLLSSGTHPAADSRGGPDTALGVPLTPCHDSWYLLVFSYEPGGALKFVMALYWRSHCRRRKSSKRNGLMLSEFRVCKCWKCWVAQGGLVGGCQNIHPERIGRLDYDVGSGMSLCGGHLSAAEPWGQSIKVLSLELTKYTTHTAIQQIT